MRREEIVRQSPFGVDAQQEADISAYELSEAAWHASWSIQELNAKKAARYIRQSSLEWNQFAGFIHYKKAPRYHYCCSLFHQFVIAQFGYENKEPGNMKARINKIGGINQEAVQKVISLYNEFCAWNGKELLHIQ